MSAKLVTWNNILDRIANMTEEERSSPVLMCGDGYYVGICRSDVHIVPKDVEKDVEILSPLRGKHVVPGRTYIQL